MNGCNECQPPGPYPLSFTSLSQTTRFFKGAKCTDTGGKFRSYVLRVMSPARFLCATPVSGMLFYVA